MLKDLSYPNMQPRFGNESRRALTFIEVLVVIALLAVLAVMILPGVEPAPRTAQRVNCVNNLKQVNLALRIWEEDNNNEYPMQVAVTNGGGKEWMIAGDVADCFRVVSNELSTARILICPADTDHTIATNFDSDFNNSHISYFFGVDVTNDNNPRMVLDGDDNLAINGTVVKSGVFDLSTNAAASWTAARHRHVGNIGFADGSVLEESSNGLQEALIQTGLATSRIAIP
jgi:prepilin-type N-terminal cleavage/methylation domain-containing protein/prepilin-type processing-associated H-X9-DG protein